MTVPGDRTTDNANDDGAPAGGARGDESTSDDSGIDWDQLTRVATTAMRRAYAPYSNYPVGAAAITDDGRTISGMNIENASYGVTLCAECSLISELFATGGGRLKAFVCVDGAGEILMPCGRCRQLLFEHRAPGMRLLTVSGVRTMEQVLPDAFGPDNLETRPSSATTPQEPASHE